MKSELVSSSLTRALDAKLTRPRVFIVIQLHIFWLVRAAQHSAHQSPHTHCSVSQITVSHTRAHASYITRTQTIFFLCNVSNARSICHRAAGPLLQPLLFLLHLLLLPSV